VIVIFIVVFMEVVGVFRSVQGGFRVVSFMVSRSGKVHPGRNSIHGSIILLDSSTLASIGFCHGHGYGVG